MSDSTTAVLGLPRELWCEIFLYLSKRDQLWVRSVCRGLYNFATTQFLLTGKLNDIYKPAALSPFIAVELSMSLKNYRNFELDQFATSLYNDTDLNDSQRRQLQFFWGKNNRDIALNSTRSVSSKIIQRMSVFGILFVNGFFIPAMPLVVGAFSYDLDPNVLCTYIDSGSDRAKMNINDCYKNLEREIHRETAAWICIATGIGSWAAVPILFLKNRACLFAQNRRTLKREPSRVKMIANRSNFWPTFDFTTSILWVLLAIGLWLFLIKANPSFNLDDCASVQDEYDYSVDKRCATDEIRPYLISRSIIAGFSGFLFVIGAPTGLGHIAGGLSSVYLAARNVWRRRNHRGPTEIELDTVVEHRLENYAGRLA